MIRFECACFEVRVCDRVNKRNQELIFGANRRNFVVCIENFGFVEIQALNDVLISVRMNGFFESLTQQELAALGRSNVTVSAQHDVVGRKRVRCYKKTKVALDDAALVFGQSVRIFPECDVARHVDLLRHPVVGAGRDVLFPCPFVFKGHKLVDVGLTVDDAFVGNIDACGRVRCHG